MDREEYLNYEPLLAKRCWAAALDYLFYLALFVGYVYLVGTENANGTFEAKGFGHLFAVAFLWFLYFPVTEGIFGFTMFKGLLDLKVVPEKRNDFRFIVCLKRHLLDPIDFIGFGIVAILLVKMSAEHKRLGDMFAHSRIIADAGNLAAATDDEEGTHS